MVLSRVSNSADQNHDVHDPPVAFHKADCHVAAKCAQARVRCLLIGPAAPGRQTRLMFRRNTGSGMLTVVGPCRSGASIGA